MRAALNACMTVFSTNKEPWFLNSGASYHVTDTSNLLSKLLSSSITSIQTDAGQTLRVEYKGTINFKDYEVKIVHDILYVPGVKTNLLSVGRSADQGHTIMSNSTSFLIYDIIHLIKTFLQAQRDKRTNNNLCGPLPTPTRQNCKYIFTFVDDFSRKTKVYFLAQKSQTFTYFSQFKQLVVTPLRKIKTLRIHG